MLVAGAMLVMLGFAALSVDMAMAFASRAEAQRTADSAALAGGSAFMEMDANLAETTVRARAYQYALRHTIRGVAVDSSEVTVQVIPDSMKVRVGINRQGLATWFARILGIDDIDVGAIAAAEAAQAGAARCLKPFAVPDIWIEPLAASGGDDTNDNRLWENGEQWKWGDDVGETYQRFEIV